MERNNRDKLYDALRQALLSDEKSTPEVQKQLASLALSLVQDLHNQIGDIAGALRAIKEQGR